MFGLVYGLLRNMNKICEAFFVFYTLLAFINNYTWFYKKTYRNPKKNTLFSILRSLLIYKTCYFLYISIIYVTILYYIQY